MFPLELIRARRENEPQNVKKTTNNGRKYKEDENKWMEIKENKEKNKEKAGLGKDRRIGPAPTQGGFKNKTRKHFVGLRKIKVPFKFY